MISAPGRLIREQSHGTNRCSSFYGIGQWHKNSICRRLLFIQNNNNYQIAPERSQKFISHNVFQIGQLLSSSMIRINVYNVKLLIVILCISLYRNFSTSPSPLPREAYRATSLCICCITASFKTKMFFLRTLFKCRSDYSLEHREIVREILGIENDNPQILMDYDLLSRSLVKLSH